MLENNALGALCVRVRSVYCTQERRKVVFRYNAKGVSRADGATAPNGAERSDSPNLARSKSVQVRTGEFTCDVPYRHRVQHIFGAKFEVKERPSLHQRGSQDKSTSRASVVAACANYSTALLQDRAFPEILG